ncbi:MAG: UDP-N-acetylmuramate--L-alanine ligase [Lachnospira sp.]
MYTIDFNCPIHIHFIGIGGISMSGLARILLDRGFTVSGSDSTSSDLTNEFSKAGCRISYPQSASNITNDIDLVVYTAAIHPDNPELQAAISANIPTITRAELLGQIMSNYKIALNIAGTHGKTTTTSMVTEILLAANADPTISVGGILNSIGGNIRVGKSDIFVTEACEYTNSFLSFNPTINIILNVKADHLDFFKDIDDIRHSFKLFTEKLPENGTLIINSDIDDYSYFYKDTKCEVITFGSDPEKSNYSASDIAYDEYGCCSYTLMYNNKALTDIKLSVPGLHNVYNSLSAIAAARKLSVDLDAIKAGLASFTGTNRRFEKKGEFNGITVIDDYAHHPDEITATLKSAAHYPHNNIWTVFQPHTYSRTKSLLKEFAQALSLSDKIVLAKIYPARETDDLGISSATLQEEIKALGKECYYYESFEDIEKFLLKNCINGDLLITMGAGDVYKIGESLLKH